MSVITEIIERLKDGQTVFKSVAGAIELSMIESRQLGSPCVFVMSAEEGSSENSRMIGPVLQRLEMDVAVVIVVKNLSGKFGAAAAIDLEDLKAFVRARLIGFTPPGAEEPITHVSGELIRASGGEVMFEDRYSVPCLLEEQP